MKSIFKPVIATLLRWEAKAILKKYNPKIVAVTGSVGKTSTKDAIFSVLSKEYPVRRSEKSFNSDIGIPLTILGCQNAWSNPISWLKNLIQGFEMIISTRPYPEWLVLEVGADRPGDIKSISEWLKPDVTVLTKFAKTPVHIEFFNNREEVIKEKGYMVDVLKHDGFLVLNADDTDAYSFKGKDNHKTMTYGINSEVDVHGSYAELYYENNHLAGMQFKVEYAGSTVPFTVKDTVGQQIVYAALAAITVGLSQNINLIKISEGISSLVSPLGRMKLISGVKGTMIIDDTYNSSPVAVHSALDALSEVKTVGRRIAVLGDMMELGKHSVEEHKDVGEAAAKSADMLVTVGIRSRQTAESAMDNGLSEKNIFQFENSVEAGDFLQNIIKNGDVILIKGSQSVRMERCVEELMLEPDKAKELFVRQEEEWKKR